ncbi:MAG TPA: helix-turn-helix transcriptional regulator [Dehalococcoidia bacterium]|nr:helix-turn-helix transcriptional regulator [Dehalococcoidia bacterium]
MIKNERQYQVTRAQLKRMDSALQRLQTATPARDADPRLLNAERNGLQSVIAELRDDLGEYERLRSGAAGAIEVARLQDFPALLIKARIAAGLTQRELAERLGLKEQQVQRYEASDYSSASMSRMLQVADTLQLEFIQPMKGIVTGLDRDRATPASQRGTQHA